MNQIDRNQSLVTFERLYWQLSRKAEYLWKEIYAKTFPGSQLHIMFTLQQNGPKKMSELADTLHITAVAITSASDHLIDHGHLIRIKDENDRRVVRLELTDKGSQTLIDLQNDGRQIMRFVFRDITDTELDMMITIFKRATTYMDKW